MKDRRENVLRREGVNKPTPWKRGPGLVSPNLREYLIVFVKQIIFSAQQQNIKDLARHVVKNYILKDILEFEIQSFS